jgi:hypothetical protein
VSDVTVTTCAADRFFIEMLQARIDLSEDLDGRPVVFACLDLGDAQIAAAAHAVATDVGERFRTATLSADDVLEFRELTALADELAEHARGAGAQTLVMPPARLTAFRDALVRFVETRHGADWIRHEDREPLERLSDLVGAVEDLCADAVRTALSPAAQRL